MTIKSDRWIRKMALEKQMIEPFVETQVRQGVVSYGLSSYGYDLRVAEEFKIFTNINSTIVDPKNFDATSFVNVTGDCIVPPNSFALARTVEYLRIPRNVITICLGKCVTGDTRVVDATTGDYVPIAEFSGRSRTVGLDGWRLRELGVSELIPQGRRPVFRLRTRAGLELRATANHPLRQLTGWTALSELRLGDRIAVAREVPVFGSTPLPGWEATLLGLLVSANLRGTPGRGPTCGDADPVLVDVFARAAKDGLGVEVTDGGQLVDLRGGAAEADRARRWRLRHGLAGEAVPPAVFRAPRGAAAAFLRALFAGGASLCGAGEALSLELRAMSRRLVEDVHHLLLRFGIASLLRDEQTELGTTAHRVQIADRAMVLRFAEQVGLLAGCEQQRALEAAVSELRARERATSSCDALPREARGGGRAAAVRQGRGLPSSGLEGGTPSRSLAVAERAASATDDAGPLALIDELGPLWDVVESIEPAGEEDVFDLSVPGAENFLANDIIIHNSTYARCGIIVNVTPFEPEWEGHATLEISNTTPLPARIYANEGLCQVLFFESDEPCETSYADKAGKYQSQGPEIVLPRM